MDEKKMPCEQSGGGVAANWGVLGGGGCVVGGVWGGGVLGGVAGGVWFSLRTLSSSFTEFSGSSCTTYP